MAVPVRFPSGVTQDAPWQPLASIGTPNPFFYHVTSDDFDELDANRYTTTALSTGTVASVAGDGGLVLFTTAATANDTIAIQKKNAGFAVVPATSTVAGKKMAYIARLQLSDVLNCGFNAGFLNTTTTAFAPTDGIFVQKVPGSAVVNLVVRVAGVSTTTPFPTTAFTLANNVPFDLAITYDGKGASIGTVYATIAYPLIGYSAQSGTGATTQTRAGSVSFQPVTFPAVNLNPTMALISNNAVANTLTLDLLGAFRER